MRTLVTLITNLGDYLISLPNETKKWLVIGLLFGLGGGSVYKLIRSLDKLYEPFPIATPEQFIAPMSDMIRQTSNRVASYQQGRNHQLSRLDSLEKAIYAKKHMPHANRPINK